MGRKWQGRDRKYNKRRHGMRITGRSVFLSVEMQVKRAGKVKKGGKRGKHK